MALQNLTGKAEVRRVADFHLTVWGDYFIKNVSDDNQMVGEWSKQADILKEEVRKMLTCPTHDPSTKLNLIDSIQRLGISHQFEKEVESALEQIYNNNNTSHHDNHDGDDLYTVALRFRLLRQEGFDVSTDIFEEFKDGKNNFKQSLINDIKGLLSLYEASHLSVQGENILDEALYFTKNHLMAIHPTSPIAAQVNHALRWPVRRGLPRKEAWHYLSFYQQDKAHIKPLLNLAKLDYNIVQHVHRKDSSSITRWWLELDFKNKLPFVRDRVIECSFWALGVFYTTEYAFARKTLSKAVAMLSVMDDIYDVHGTIQELELFTRVIESWDVSMKDELPDYMKWYFEALLDFYGEIETQTTTEGRSFCIHYAKEAMRKQVRAYITEARWFNNDYVPTYEEYISVAVMSSTYPILITLSVCSMGHIASKEILDWLSTMPKLLYTASGLARLIDDIKSHEFEQERGHVASAVECYMKQHCVSKEEAYNELNKIVGNMWKDFNEELVKESGKILKPVLECILNMVRVMDVVYKDGDSYTFSNTSLKDILSNFLLNPVPV